MAMTISVRVLIVVAASALFALWLSEIVRKYDPLLLIVAHFSLLCIAIWFLRRQLKRSSILVRVLAGAIGGYVVAIGAAGVTELVIGGLDEFGRLDKSSLFYPYPVLSFGWLHGAVVVALLYGKKATLSHCGNVIGNTISNVDSDGSRGSGNEARAQMLLLCRGQMEFEASDLGSLR